MNPSHRLPEIVFMFAGQGSQYYAMGLEMYENKPVFRDWLNFCSRSLESRLKVSLVDLIYSRKSSRPDVFEITRYTHPAVFCLNYSLAQTLIHEGIRPSRLLGYSLGELVAWTFAGTVRLEEALNLVVEMAFDIEQRTAPGGMLAVLASAALLKEEPELFSEATLAGINYRDHFVVAGTKDKMVQIHDELKRRNILCQILPISHGFHSPLLDPIESEVKRHFSALSLRDMEVPVVSSALGRDIEQRDLSADYCWTVLRGPVRFSDAVQHMEKNGPSLYIDAGPSGTLAGFVRNIVGRDAASRAYAVLNPFGKDLRSLEKLKSEIEAAQVS